MPWKETSAMDERPRFVQDVHRPGWSIAEPCRRCEVSRKTGYKWLRAYAVPESPPAPRRDDIAPSPPQCDLPPRSITQKMLRRHVQVARDRPRHAAQAGSALGYSAERAAQLRQPRLQTRAPL
jgi:transposase-like protein